MSKLKIVAAIVDVRQLKLYKEDGETIEIPQGDTRVATYIAEITPQIRARGWAEIDFEPMGQFDTETFRNFEATAEKSGGFVKLFRMAKKKVEDFFKGRVPDQQIGTIPNQGGEDALGAEAAVTLPKTPVSDAATVEAQVAAQKQVEQLDAALEDIMKHATPASSPKFAERKVGDGEDDTVVAVVEREDGTKTIIPHIERITGQLERANKLGTTKAVEAFMARIAKVIDKRSHSADDLLKFMQRADLPIAEDGSIIIYKVLRRHPTQAEHYVDCHTRKVPQRVGSYVFMDESLVDHNRNNECSNGLHVARRGYLSGFGGDLCVMAKLAPEDVIAVPSYDANKMRVCGYHIIFELPDAMYTKLRQDKPITDTEEGQRLLARAIAGDHIGIIEHVKIGAQLGGSIKVTQVVSAESLIETIMSTSAAKEDGKPMLAEAIEVKDSEPAPKLDAPIVDPKEVAKQVMADKTPSLQDRAKALHQNLLNSIDDLGRQASALDLREFKKKSRKSWAYLGLSETIEDEISKILCEDKPSTKPAKVDRTKEPKESNPQKLAENLLKSGKSNVEVAKATGLSKDQVYRIKKKL